MSGRSVADVSRIMDAHAYSNAHAHLKPVRLLASASVRGVRRTTVRTLSGRTVRRVSGNCPGGQRAQSRRVVATKETWEWETRKQKRPRAQSPRPSGCCGAD